MRQKGPIYSCCIHGTILACGAVKIRYVGKAHLSCCFYRTLLCAQQLCVVGKIYGSMRSERITYSYCFSGAIVAWKIRKAGKMSCERATKSSFSHDTPPLKLRENVCGQNDRLPAAACTVVVFYQGKLRQFDQCIRSEIPTSSCINIALTLSSTSLRERENRRTSTLEKAHL